MYLVNVGLEEGLEQGRTTDSELEEIEELASLFVGDRAEGLCEKANEHERGRESDMMFNGGSIEQARTSSGSTPCWLCCTGIVSVKINSECQWGARLTTGRAW